MPLECLHLHGSLWFLTIFTLTQNLILVFFILLLVENVYAYFNTTNISPFLYTATSVQFYRYFSKPVLLSDSSSCTCRATNQKQTDIRSSISREIAAESPKCHFKMSSALLERHTRNILAHAPKQQSLLWREQEWRSLKVYQWNQTW